MATTEPLVYDPFLFYEQPDPIFQRLRDEAPLYHNPERSIWVLSRFADVQAAGRDWRTFSSAEGVDIDDSRLGPGSFLDADPPRHDQLRKILHAEFTPAKLRRLEHTVTARVHELVDALIARGQVDLTREFALRLPISVVCDLLGAPAADHHRLERWYVGMLERVPGETAVSPASLQAAKEMRGYIIDAVNQRLDSPCDDLFTTIAIAHGQGLLSIDEVDGMCRLLLLAGVHTTASLISNSLILLEHRVADRRSLAERPELIPNAIEELLRYTSPVQAGARVITRAVELHDQVVPQGDRVLLLWASANRDPRHYHDPETLDLTRDPQRNIAFGEGIHFCLGAPLARLETRIAFQILFARIPEYDITGPIERHFTFLERGIAGLPADVRSG